jgi:kynureninase
MSYHFETDEDYAHKLDQEDPLARFRQRFYIPGNTIYMDGNSLGLLSKDAENSTLKRLSEWKTQAIKGWLQHEHPWFYLAEELGAKCAKLVGAQPEEVVATGTTTINIHALAHTFYQPFGKRTKILADELNFPSDIYALNSLIRLRGLNPQENLILTPSKDGRTLDENKIIELMTEEVALVFLPSVLYRSGQLLDIHRLTEEAHKCSIPIGFDCSHSVGIVPHDFDEWQTDFALWCSYKYLNGGPGATAFLYINKKHFQLEPALPGWFGYQKDKQFNMALNFEHAQNAGGWQISSPAILSSAPLEGALSIILEAGIQQIREKSVKMTSYLIYLVDELLSKPPYDYSVGTPREPQRRGGHVAIEHSKADTIIQELIRKGIVPDYRPPNIIRTAPASLYTEYHEIWQMIDTLKQAINQVA